MGGVVIVLVLVRVECKKCGTSCQTYCSQGLEEGWCERWAAKACPDHRLEKTDATDTPV